MATGKTAPDFWFQPFSWRALALAPTSWFYGSTAARRMANAKPQAVDAPVVCVGNFTVGGTGKTPTAQALITAATAADLKPGIVMRGYGGKKRKPHMVDAKSDTASDVGDEALLFARTVPTVVGKDRAANAKLLLDAGCDFVIMDDGFQSRTLHYDYSVMTVDARRGFGNGRSLPAGPMRAPVHAQLPYADLVLLIGEGSGADKALRVVARAGKQIARASIIPVQAKTLLRKKMIAFSGIGDPEKFFDTLRANGATVPHVQAFPDHHEYSELDASGLLDAANRKKLALVTTEKDMARLRPHKGQRGELAQRAQVLKIEMKFAVECIPHAIIEDTLTRYRQRRLSSR
ncbi:MAG: tetraacyldisaccharide 4'-kinase [Pseudomonadota bacterium]